MSLCVRILSQLVIKLHYKAIWFIACVATVFFFSKHLTAQSSGLKITLESIEFDKSNFQISKYSDHYIDSLGFIWLANRDGCFRVTGKQAELIYSKRHFSSIQQSKSEYCEHIILDEVVTKVCIDDDSYRLSSVSKKSFQEIHYDSIAYDNFSINFLEHIKDMIMYPEETDLSDSSKIAFKRFEFKNEIASINYVNSISEATTAPKDAYVKLVELDSVYILFHEMAFFHFNKNGKLINKIVSNYPFIFYYGETYSIKDGQLYYLKKNKIYSYNFQSQREEIVFALDQYQLETLWEHRIHIFDRFIIISGSKQNLIIDRSTGEALEISSTLNDFKQAVSRKGSLLQINQISELRSNQFLLSIGNHLAILDISTQNAQNYKIPLKKGYNLITGVRGMALDRDKQLFVSYYNNIVRIDPKSRNPDITELIEQDEIKSKWNPFHLSIYKDKILSSSLILNSKGSRLLSLDNNPLFYNHAVHCISGDRAIILPWTIYNIHEYNFETEELEVNPLSEFLIDTDNDTNDLLEDSLNDGYWVLPELEGPVLLDKAYKETKFRVNQDVIDRCQEFYDLEYSDTTLYIGTRNALMELDLNTFQYSIFPFHNYFRQEPSECNEIFTVTNIDTDTLWLGTALGVYGFDKVNKQFLQLSDPTLFQDVEFNRASNLHVDSLVFLGSTTGLYRLPIGDIQWSIMDDEQNDFTLLDLVIKDGRQDLRNLNADHIIQLDSDDNFVQVNFGVDDYVNNPLYSWRLSERDTIWSEYTTQAYADVQDIPYGLSNFEVKFSYGYSDNNTDIQSIKLNRAKPFYLHLWFILACLILILIIAILFYRRIQSSTNQLVRKLNQVRTLERINRHDYLNYLEGLRNELLKSNSVPPKAFRSIMLKLDSTILSKEAESKEIQKTWFNCYLVVHDLIELYNELYRENQITLSGEKVIMINQNRSMSVKILENIISNIYKHSGRASSLKIGLDNDSLILHSDQKINTTTLLEINQKFEFPKPLQEARKGLELSSLLAFKAGIKIKYFPNDTGYEIRINSK